MFRKEICTSRHWYLPELLVRRPKETRDRLLELLSHHAHPWEFASIFQGCEGPFDVPILNFLLDALEPLLRSEIVDGILPGRGSVAWLSCDLLMKVTDFDLIECFRRRRGSKVESAIVDWLLCARPSEILNLSSMTNKMHLLCWQ